MKSLILITGFCLFAATTSAISTSSEKQTLRDWEVYCKDNLYCIASTEGQTKEGEKMRFKLERSDKQDTIIFVTTAPENHALKLGMKVRIYAEGFDEAFSGNIKKVYDGNEMAFRERPESELLALLKKARFGKVSIEFSGKTGLLTYDVSLKGVTSVLAYMDIIQGRLDRADAAVIVGGEAITSISNYDFRAARAPLITQDDEKEAATQDPEETIDYEVSNEERGIGDISTTYKSSDLSDRVLIPGYRTLGCDLPAAIEAFGAQIVNIEPGVFLYFVPCTLADLNIPHYIMLEDAGKLHLLEFQEAASETGERIALISNPLWEKSFNGLTLYEYFSPNQDCGKHEKHIFDDTEQVFYLSEARFKENCNNVVTAPKDYPLSWSGEGD